MQNPISIIWVPELNPDFSSFRRFMTRVNTSFNSINDFILNALIKEIIFDDSLRVGYAGLRGAIG